MSININPELVTGTRTADGRTATYSTYVYFEPDVANPAVIAASRDDVPEWSVVMSLADGFPGVGITPQQARQVARALSLAAKKCDETNQALHG